MTFLDVFLLCPEEIHLKEGNEFRTLITEMNKRYDICDLHFNLAVCEDESAVAAGIANSCPDICDSNDSRIFLVLLNKAIDQEDIEKLEDAFEYFKKTGMLAILIFSFIETFYPAEEIKSFINRLNVDLEEFFLTHINIHAAELILELQIMNIDLQTVEFDSDGYAYVPSSLMTIEQLSEYVKEAGW